MAAICARKSPAVSFLARMLAQNILKTSVSRSPRARDLDDREDDALLVDLPAGGEAARIGAADVDVVREIGGIGDDPPAVEDRREHDDVVQMHAALVGVVGDELVARLQIARAVALDRLRER